MRSPIFSSRTLRWQSRVWNLIWLLPQMRLQWISMRTSPCRITSSTSKCLKVWIHLRWHLELKIKCLSSKSTPQWARTPPQRAVNNTRQLSMPINNTNNTHPTLNFSIQLLQAALLASQVATPSKVTERSDKITHNTIFIPLTMWCRCSSVSLNCRKN